MHTHRSTWLASAALVALLLSVAGCSAFSDMEDTAQVGIDRTAHILDEGIASLQNNSADWQKVLKDTAAKLSDDSQSTLRNEVSDLLYRGIAATGAEVRCNADFVANRVLLGLIRIKAEFLKEPVPPTEPKLCSVVPLAIDRALVAQGRLNRLELYGYDLDAGPIQVLLQKGDEQIDVSQVLNRPTHYHMTLTLGGSTGVPITAASQRIIIKWSGQELSTISVIHPVTPICKKQVVTHQPTAIHFIPPKVDNGGDADFSGHGPDVNARVRLINNSTSVSAELFMSAKETMRDWTWAQGTRADQIFVPDRGWHVTDMLVPSANDSTCPAHSTCYAYTDTNRQPDIFSAGSGPAQRFEFMGETEGAEAGTRTGMTVTFNALRFEVTENGDCVSQSALEQLKRLDLLSPETLERLAPVRH